VACGRHLVGAGPRALRDGGDEAAIGYDILELVAPELIVLRSDPRPEMGMHEPMVVRIELHDHGRRRA
jgi:hypothetical protein